MDRTATVQEVVTTDSLVLYCGNANVKIMADPFGDSLFSVFDDEQQATSSKKAPASLTPDIGYVLKCLLTNFVLAARKENVTNVARNLPSPCLLVPTVKHLLFPAIRV